MNRRPKPWEIRFGWDWLIPCAVAMATALVVTKALLR